MSRCALRRSDRTRHQILEIAEYITEQGQPAAADRFIESCDAACRKLQDWPGSGHRLETGRDDLRAVRVVPIPGFNTLLYFRHESETVEVIAILHGSRGSDAVQRSLE